MDVLFYLKELLKSHKTISIDGLGTLYKKKSPGKYDEQKRSFVPPSYTLSFTREINEPEELASFIALEQNINTELASLHVKEFAEKILVQLENQQEVTLSGIGKFILIDSEITFLTDEDNDLGNEFYGLPNLHEITEPSQNIAGIADEEVNSTDQKEPDTSGSENELHGINTENQLKYTGKPFTPNYDYDDDSGGEMSKPVKMALRVLLVITIIAAVIGLAYFFNPAFFDNIRGNNNEISIAEPVITNDSLTKEDTQLSIDTTAANLDSNVVVKEQPKTIIVPLPKPINNGITSYEVIGSAEKSQKRIDLVINTMKKRGIEAKALENVPGRLTKISLGSFTNLALAKKYKDSLRKKLNNPEIYIQSIKPKK